MDTLKEINNIAESLKVKVCTKCGKTKHGDEVSFSSSWCSLCIKEYKKQYREKNKEKIRVKKKEYCDNHKKEKANYDRKYSEKNSDKIKVYRKKYKDENRLELAEKNKEYYKKIKDTNEYKKRCIIYRKKVEEKINKRSREHGLKQRKNLTDIYIKRRIIQHFHINEEDITSEMIEIKRAQITLHRLTSGTT